MSKLILAINAGSSSLKFQLIEMPEEKIVTKGLIERIGLKDSVFTIEVNGDKIKETNDIADHEEAVNIMLDSFKNMVSLIVFMTLMVLDTELYMVANYSQSQFI